MDHLQDDLRDAYGKSASLACEQIAAIRTVASLRREDALLVEFCDSMNAPVRKAIIATTKSTLVPTFLELSNLDLCFQPGRTTFHQRISFFNLSENRHCSSGMEANCLSQENTPSSNSLYAS